MLHAPHRQIRAALAGGLLLTAAACSTPAPVLDEPARPPDSAFDRRFVAVMRTSNLEAAERLRNAVLGGEPPPSALIVPIGELERINPSLSPIAARLGECAVSQAIATNAGPEGAGYVVLQRGGEPGDTCRPSTMGLAERAQRAEEWAGELFIGLLVVGLVVLGVALPFLLL